MVLEGEGVLETKENIVHLKKGMVIFISKEISHRHGAVDENYFIQLSIIL